MTGYAVIDVETTGFCPGKHDRVVEIAIVHVDLDGGIVDEWSTLVNPMRDLGPVSVHGIRAADVRHAPTFDQLAGTVARLLAGRVPVAHNLPFDAMFLAAEFGRLGVAAPVLTDYGLCTMRLADRYLPGTVARSLHACCAAAGIRLERTHEALSDARATAALLAHYLTVAETPPPWTALLREAAARPWPSLPAGAPTPIRRGHSPAAPAHFLTRLVDRLPRVPEPRNADHYLAVLDAALLDRFISASEADALVALAERLGLDRQTVRGLHRDYLSALAAAAWQDGVITAEEHADLRLVATLLGLGDADVDAALLATEPVTGTAPGAAATLATFRLAAGDQVVFTGEMREPRETWENRARAAGLTVNRNVTKKTRLVVAADPDTLSAKGSKARDYGIPIVTEEAFARLLTAMDTAPAKV